MQKIEIDAAPPKALEHSDHYQVHIALDFDGTLAHYDSWSKQQNVVGKPIEPMVRKVKEWLAKGYKVSIFTARVSQPDAAKNTELIQQFLKENGLPELPITCMKMFYFTHFFDDKAYHVGKNTGIIRDLPNFNLK